MATAVLFDLDGTLLDTLQDLAASTNAALRAFGYPERTVEEVRRFVGNGAERLIRLAVPEGADPLPVLSCFRAHYQAHCREKTGPYEGVMELLAQVAARYPVAIVSNKPDSAVKALCKDYFPGIYALGESEGCPRKPAPDMVYKAMGALGAERCIYIGDSEVDILTAKNAGAACISVTWGFRDEQTLRDAGATCLCATPQQVLEQIEAMMK